MPPRATNKAAGTAGWQDAAANQVVVRKKPKTTLTVRRRKSEESEFSALARLFAAQAE